MADEHWQTVSIRPWIATGDGTTGTIHKSHSKQQASQVKAGKRKGTCAAIAQLRIAAHDSTVVCTRAVPNCGVTLAHTQGVTGCVPALAEHASQKLH